MRQRSFVLLVIALVVLIGAVVAVYAYDRSREDRIAKGITVGGVSIGGLSADEARAKLERELEAPLQEPVVVRARGRTFRLSPRRADVQADLGAMVSAALERSRDGNIVTRTYRDLSGAGVDDGALEPDVTHDRRAVDALVRRVKRTVDRPAKDASVEASPGGLTKVAGRTGVAVRGNALEDDVAAALLNPVDRSVQASTRITRPKVTKAQLAAKYPDYLIVNRATFQLKHYENLKLKKTYTVAVGAAGFDTPAGVYHIQNKAVNPAWNVPQEEWAGSLAGTVVPGGTPQNPLKARWMGIFDGAGIHGTDQVGSLGTRASHGCVRMSIPDVTELYDTVDVQTPIYIGG